LKYQVQPVYFIIFQVLSVQFILWFCNCKQHFNCKVFMEVSLCFSCLL